MLQKITGAVLGLACQAEISTVNKAYWTSYNAQLRLIKQYLQRLLSWLPCLLASLSDLQRSACKSWVPIKTQHQNVLNLSYFSVWTKGSVNLLNLSKSEWGQQSQYCLATGLFTHGAFGSFLHHPPDLKTGSSRDSNAVSPNICVLFSKICVLQTFTFTVPIP